MMQIYNDWKSKHPDIIHLFKCGDFFMTFDKDAEDISSILGITLMVRKNKARTAGFPKHRINEFLTRLLRAGRRVMIHDQETEEKL